MSTTYGRHRPLTHPIVRERLQRGMQICDPADVDYFQPALPIDIPASGVLPPISAAAIARMTDRLDDLAYRVHELPRQPLSTGQRRMAKVIAAELMRLALESEGLP